MVLMIEALPVADAVAAALASRDALRAFNSSSGESALSEVAAAHILVASVDGRDDGRFENILCGHARRNFPYDLCFPVMYPFVRHILAGVASHRWADVVSYSPVCLTK